MKNRKEGKKEKRTEGIKVKENFEKGRGKNKCTLSGSFSKSSEFMPHIQPSSHLDNPSKLFDIAHF